MSAFPTVLWKNETATFIAVDTPPITTIPTPAALVFPFYGNRVVLADIATRGWCIPSGHIEEGETAEQAVRREAVEEAGAMLGKVIYIGYFVLTQRITGAIRHAPTFIASVDGLGVLPPGEESRGMQLAEIEDVANLYFSWDELLSSVFSYAWEKKEVLLTSGQSLDSFMTEAG